MQIKAAKEFRVTLISIWHTTPNIDFAVSVQICENVSSIAKTTRWFKLKFDNFPAIVQEKFLYLRVRIYMQIKVTK